MKVILTGANGQLGHAIKDCLQQEANIKLYAYDSSSLDITHTKRVQQVCAENKADFFINAAAYTKVDLAEKEADKAYATNAQALKQICQSCNEFQTHLIHFSSDYVYHSINGRPILESDICTPKGIYAKSKLDGDNQIFLHCNSYSILRTSWVYGPKGKHFVDTMLKLGKTRDELQIVSDQIGSPTYTLDIAELVLRMMEMGYQKNLDQIYGLYNFSNAGQTNWADFARKIFEIKKIKTRVKSISTEDYGAPAARPLWSVMSKEKIKKRLDVSLNHWEDKLFDYLKAYS